MNYYKTRQAAQMLGISKQTLVRWEREKKVPLAKRDYLNHRAYTEKDIIKIREIIGLGVLRDPFTSPQEDKCQI